MEKYFGQEISKLGFGLMRLPKLEDGSIDIEQVKVMADMYIKAGGTYFDTAYIYDKGASEEAFKAAVADRYPRESYTVATKLNAAIGAKDEASAKQQFYTSLERLGTGYVDFYLLHALQPGNHHLYDEYNLWEYAKELKEKGLVKHWGFSFHASPELLEKKLQEHPDAEFVQLQVNYADWENDNVASKACCEIARKYGKPIVVMEPIKGGTLANPHEKIKKLFKDANPDASFASWAVRFAASVPGIMTVLSGMSNIEQMEDNLSYMSDFKPLTESELKVIEEAQKVIKEDVSIPCTACHYCTDNCPMQIPIPEIFKLANDNIFAHTGWSGVRDYKKLTQDTGKASDCARCGQCEAACPQHLSIIDLLESCTDFEV